MPMVVGHHRSYSSFRGSDPGRGDRRRGGSDDGIIDDRDDRFSDSRDAVKLGALREREREDLKRPLPLEHLDRDVDMRSPHDTDLPPIDEGPHSHGSHAHSSHSTHHGYSLHYHSQHPSRHDVEMRAAKKMRIESDSTAATAAKGSTGHGRSPSDGRAAAPVGGIP